MGLGQQNCYNSKRHCVSFCSKIYVIIFNFGGPVCAKAHSRPVPTVQPTRVSLWVPEAGSITLSALKFQKLSAYYLNPSTPRPISE